MTNDQILFPVFTLTTLTAVIWVLMYIRRIAEVSRLGIDPQTLATNGTTSARLKNVTAADNFSNLLETPVLFYVICGLLIATHRVTETQLVLAWIFVLLRVLHSVIHVTYNRVVHRWLVYVISTICLFLMWGVFVVSTLFATL